MMSDIRARNTSVSSHGNASSSVSDGNQHTQSRRSRLQPTFDNLVWIIAAFAVLYFSNFASVILFEPKVLSEWFWLSVALLTLYIGIVVYIFKYKPEQLSSNSWRHSSPPRLIILSSIAGVGAGLCFIVSVWPVWNYYTLLIVPTLFMGCLSTISLFNL